jgi:CarD family transcriptional regulator
LFEIGEMAVYPAHGVGVIESVEERSIGEIEQSFYIMRICDSNMVIMIPVDSCKSVGLRRIINEAEVADVYKILETHEFESSAQPWNQRYREYMERIKTGSVIEIAGVLRDLYLLQEEKTLSFGERKMLDTAKNLLTKEISIANGKDEDDVRDEIEQIFES